MDSNSKENKKFVSDELKLDCLINFVFEKEKNKNWLHFINTIRYNLIRKHKIRYYT